jgi:hypothetical protein
MRKHQPVDIEEHGSLPVYRFAAQPAQESVQPNVIALLPGQDATATSHLADFLLG